jgi:hypothetical protein
MTALIPEYHSDSMFPWRRRAGVAIWMAQLQREHLSSAAPLAGGNGPTVSLTSYGSRIRHVHLTLESIAQGKLVPARTVLWLSDRGLQRHIPANLRRLIKRGLELRFTEDLGPHKKYFPFVMQERIDAPLVTADDDVLYPRFWLSELHKAYSARPGNVHAFRVHVAKLDASGLRFRPYAEWSQCTTTRSSRNNFSTGCSGVLFPPEVLCALRASGRNFEACCPWADDIWLNLHAQRTGHYVAQVRDESMRFLGVLLTQRKGLFHRNVYGNGNDEALAATFSEADYVRLTAQDDRVGIGF